MNAITILQPYLHAVMWVFDDPGRGLLQRALAQYRIQKAQNEEGTRYRGSYRLEILDMEDENSKYMDANTNAVPVNFTATFLPDIRKFKIVVKTPDQQYIELMDGPQFLLWVESLGKLPTMVIAGVILADDEGTRPIRESLTAYFKEVARRYSNLAMRLGIGPTHT